MKIGILTYYRVANYGANLQALSTYHFLKNLGHDVIFIRYSSKRTDYILSKTIKLKQVERHISFIDEYLPCQTEMVYDSKGVSEVIKKHNIEGVIIGSDAVVQHHPLFSTLKLPLFFKRPYWFEPIEAERRYPNVFWGIGSYDIVPTAMMSVSSQNSEYERFSKNVLKRMSKDLSSMTYISVRDEWTKKMMLKANRNLDIKVTPDPVFALNWNLEGVIPSEDDIRNRFLLPDKYALIGLRSQSLSIQELEDLNKKLNKHNIECVAFPISSTIEYKHNFKYSIPLPLSPLDWYALIKYSSAYIGSNMHPIVSSLANGVPCFSLDNWGSTDFWGHKKKNGSSKVYDILNQFGIPQNHSSLENGKATIELDDIVSNIVSYPLDMVRVKANMMYQKYHNMMESIISSINTSKQ